MSQTSIHMINYTFIIPHKNVPTLLTRCLNSIPQREDVEIIIVDDNSNPDIVDFENFPGTNHNNVSCYFVKENKGAGHARNIGIEHATGKWLLFADADDFYTEQINYVLDKYKDTNELDLVYLNAQSYIEESETYSPLSFDLYFKHFAKSAIYSEKVLRYNMWTPWTRMVRRDFVMSKVLRFEEVPVGNDRMFCLGCSEKANSFSVEADYIYNYYVPVKGSVTKAYSISLDTFNQRLELMTRANQLYSRVNYLFKDSYIYFYLSLPKASRTNDVWNMLVKFLRENKISIIKDVRNLIVYVVGKKTHII